MIMKVRGIVYTESTLCDRCIEDLKNLLKVNNVNFVEYKMGEVLIKYNPAEVNLDRIRQILINEMFLIDYSSSNTTLTVNRKK